MTWHIYIIRCRDNTLYTGITTDVVRRMEEHNNGVGAKYTKTRRPVKLVYQEIAKNRSEALKREWAIKHLSKQEKCVTIESC